MSLNRFTPRDSTAVHLLRTGDVFVEFNDPTRKRWTVVANAQIVDHGNGIEYVEVKVKESTHVVRYPHWGKPTRVRLWHDSQFTRYNYA